MKLEDQVNRRIEEHRAALLKIIALLRDGQISISEARRRSRAADRELRAIRKLIEKFPATKRAKKTKRTKIKEPEQAPPGPKISWMGRKDKSGKTTYRIGG